MSTPMVWIFPRCGFFWLREVFLIWKVALGADKFTPSVWFFSQQCTALDWKYAFFYLGQTVSHKGVNLFTTVISSSLKVCTFVGGYDDTIPGCECVHNYFFFDGSQLWTALDWNYADAFLGLMISHQRCDFFFTTVMSSRLKFYILLVGTFAVWKFFYFQFVHPTNLDNLVFILWVKFEYILCCDLALYF